MLWVVYKAPESPFLVVLCLDTHPHAFWHFSQKHCQGTRSFCLRESAPVCSTSPRSWVLWFICLLSEFITHWEGAVTSCCFLLWWGVWNLFGVFPRERWLLWGSFLWRGRVLWQKSSRPCIWSSICRPFCRRERARRSKGESSRPLQHSQNLPSFLRKVLCSSYQFTAGPESDEPRICF